MVTLRKARTRIDNVFFRKASLENGLSKESEINNTQWNISQKWGPTEKIQMFRIVETTSPLFQWIFQGVVTQCKRNINTSKILKMEYNLFFSATFYNY